MQLLGNNGGGLLDADDETGGKTPKKMDEQGIEPWTSCKSDV